MMRGHVFNESSTRAGGGAELGVAWTGKSKGVVKAWLQSRQGHPLGYRAGRVTPTPAPSPGPACLSRTHHGAPVFCCVDVPGSSSPPGFTLLPILHPVLSE